MTDTNPFTQLNPIAFLQNFVSQSIEISQDLGCSKCNHHENYIEHLGFNASACFEAAYRKEHTLTEPFDQDQYAELIVALKNKIGGNFSRASSDRGVVRVINTRCPFGEAVKQAPQLCQMTSSVFGGIAARNFGYAKVELKKRIAVGDGMCEVCIYTDEKQAANYKGDEYRQKQGLIVGKAATADAVLAVEQQMQKVWCGAKSGKRGGNGESPYIVARSQAMRDALGSVQIVAPTAATVLITGETGTGKELIARAIHAMSPRWPSNFVAVNCGAIPENLIESALFGHERGAFTGAYEVHHGLFERAEKGTLFLDEVDSLPLAAQARLLRVLQEGEFDRVGGKQSLRADVRVIAAGSNRLAKLVANGDFRTDLFYRLNVVPINIPPLRERPEDISPLLDHLLTRLSVKYGREVRAISQSAMMEAMAYDWPGNVRELENVLERSFLFSSGRVITKLMVAANDKNDKGSAVTNDGRITLKQAKKAAAEKVETKLLQETLGRFNGNVSAAAKFLGLTARAVHQKLNVHGIDPSLYRTKPELRVIR